ncbi:MAG TPA: response regulator [Anaerolineae bacterium]|jgi:response regulator NasT|nr:response regulator [Anaerolineae bacterium]
MRILIADDESIIRLGLKAMLGEMGHEVIAAMNGREAIQMAKRQLPDLAILDIKMPYTDGLQAAKAICRGRPIPILILTAFSDSDLIEKATDLPIQGYLIKPIQPADLTAAISVATKRFEEGKELTERAQQLEEDIKTRKLVEQAKGKLMEAGLSEEDAYRALQIHARKNRKTMRDAARSILGDGGV